MNRASDAAPTGRRGCRSCPNCVATCLPTAQVPKDIDHSKTRARNPQTNGICERFHKTVQDEFYAVVFWKSNPGEFL